MRRRSEETRARLLATFRLEAEEHLQAIHASLASLRTGEGEGGESPAALALFRSVHTLKGAARSVGLLQVETVCQSVEALLRRVTQGELRPTPELLNCLQETADDLGKLVDGSPARSPVEAIVRILEEAASGDVGEGPEREADPAVGLASAAPDPSLVPEGPSHPPGTSGPTEAGKPARVRKKGGTIRVATAQLDSLLLQLEDLLLPKLAARQRVRELEAFGASLAAHRRESAGMTGADLRPLEADFRQLLRRMREDERRLARIHEQLQTEVLRLRTSPVSTVVDAFPGMVRDLAREAGKEIELTLAGAELQLDRRVLERIKDPLIHLVRNAVDHGIEVPTVRERTGKPRRGRIAITFTPAENRKIEVLVQDDGEGVRLEEVRAAATRSRLLTAEESHALDERAAVDLLFHSGFSTSPVVTRVSGHGLGLPIVRERVENLGGTLQLESIVSKGTTVRMLLPATVATFTGLLVGAGGQSFLLPLDAVEHVLRVTPADVGNVEGRAVIRLNGQYIRAAPLNALLDLPPMADPSRADRLPCVIVGVGNDRLGLLVDEVRGEQEMLVKELEPPLNRIRHVAGAGLLGTGSLVLILRPADLLRTAVSTRVSHLPPEGAAQRERAPVVLVVDDSITTRTMEKNLLESAGYTVKTAVDGLEAWALLQSEACDLVVSDVDMPRMDGFELTTRIRDDATLRDLPVILVTAMESREYRERGVLAGANAYVIKSSFEESNLLEIIQRLV